jgi:hypothetical protein
VPLDIAGTARPGIDYLTLPSQVIIPAGQQSITVAVTPIKSDVPVTPEVLQNGITVLLRSGTLNPYAVVQIIKITNAEIWAAASAQVTQHEFVGGQTMYQDRVVSPKPNVFDMAQFAGPQWQNGNVLAPYAYVRASTPAIDAHFSVSRLLDNLKVDVVGFVQGIRPSAAELDVPYEAEFVDRTVTIKNGMIKISGVMASKALPLGVDFYNRAEISWRLRFSKNAALPDRSASTSESPLYITYSPIDPKQFSDNGIRPTLTVLDYGCRNANGTTDPQRLLQVIWSRFSALRARRVEFANGTINPNGIPLRYYGSWLFPTFDNQPVLTSSYQKLLAYGDGVCGSWAEFFFATLAAQGLESKANGVGAVYQTILPADGFNIFFVGSWNIRPNQGNNPIVNQMGPEFNFDPKNPAAVAALQQAFPGLTPAQIAILQRVDPKDLEILPHFHQILPAGGGNPAQFKYDWLTQDFRWVPRDSLNQPTSPAQNNPFPLGVFANHAVVMIGKTDGSQLMFDPAYGKIYGRVGKNAQFALLDFQSKAIAGFGTFKKPFAKNVREILVTPVGNLADGELGLQFGMVRGLVE